MIGYEVFKDYDLFDYEASVLLLVRTDEKGNPFEPVPTWEYRPLGSFGVQVVVVFCRGAPEIRDKRR